MKNLIIKITINLERFSDSILKKSEINKRFVYKKFYAVIVISLGMGTGIQTHAGETENISPDAPRFPSFDSITDTGLKEFPVEPNLKTPFVVETPQQPVLQPKMQSGESVRPLDNNTSETPNNRVEKSTTPRASNNVLTSASVIVKNKKPTKSLFVPSSIRKNNDLLNSRSDLWERMRIGFTMRQLNSPHVKEYESFHMEHPEYIQKVFERGKKYLYFILEEVEKRGMPTEIALLPFIESEFNPKAYSRAKAAGIWQFIPSTGKNFGLVQNSWYDGRRDILAATQAALDYLQTLYDMFGDWELALAGYNWGEGALTKAINRSQSDKISVDYLNLKMPLETRLYVPKLIALRNIIANPDAYNIRLPDVPNRPYFITVENKYSSLDLHMAAKLANIPIEEFKSLNAGYSRTVITPHASALLIPADKADLFTSNLQNFSQAKLQYPESIQSPTIENPSEFFKIPDASKSAKQSETVPNLNPKPVGQNVKITLPTVLDLVDVKNPRHLDANRRRNHETSQFSKAPKKSQGTVSKTIEKGDTLYSLAKKNNVSVDELKRLNNLSSHDVKIGQKIKIK